MGQASALPVWVNLIWMSISGITLLGACVWTILIFWPYLRETKKMQLEALELGRKSSDTLAKMVEDLKPLTEKADRAIERADRIFGKLTEEDVEKLRKVLDRGAKSVEPLPVPPRRGDLVARKTQKVEAEDNGSSS